MRRDTNGKVIDGLITRIKSWLLGRKLRKGIIPRGRGGNKMSAQEAQAILAGTHTGVFPEMISTLSAKLIHANGSVVDYGLVSVKKVTTAFRDYLVDSLQNSTTHPMDVFKYHAAGTDNTAEANTQTALITEVESRVAGTQIEGATANIFKTVATIDFTATRSIYEHGVLSASTAGTLMDRSVHAIISVVNTDSIQYTYELTTNAEA